MSEPFSAGVVSGEVDRLAAEVVAEITDRLHAGERIGRRLNNDPRAANAEALRPGGWYTRVCLHGSERAWPRSHHSHRLSRGAKNSPGGCNLLRARAGRLIEDLP